MSNKRGAVFWSLLTGACAAAAPGRSPAQTPPRAPLLSAAETRRYAIEVAGLRVGTMTATRQPQPGPGGEVVSTLTSDVKVNFLLYHLKIYYQVVNRTRRGQLLLSTVEAHTNRGNFASRTEWLTDHYAIRAEQYQHHYEAAERQPITCTVTDMIFAEPTGQTRAFAEYFGDFFSLARATDGSTRAHRAGREDEYRYANGRLVMIIKKNPLKNFVIRLLP